MRVKKLTCSTVWPGAVLLLLTSFAAPASTNLSVWTFPGSSGRVLAQPDALGNRIPDYSGVGYEGGTTPIPDVPVKITLSPVAGDDAATIQAAINSVKALPLDANGFRGTILLNAGEYQIAGNLTIDASGIVLRGVGAGTNGTVLRASGAGQRTLIRVTGTGSASTVANTTRNLTNNYVPVGARSFNVDSTSGLAVGDRVMVRRIATDEWIQDLGMDLLGPGSGGEPDDVPWTTNGYQLDFDRIITRIEGNRITVDAPITCAIEAKYAGGTIRKFTWSGRINNVGIEDIRGVSDFDPSVTTNSPSPTYFSDEDHAWTFIQFNSVENAWVRRVTSQYFGYACVALYGGARCVTVQNAQSLDPVSIITGARRYAFVMDDAQLCLVQNSYTHKDRHHFVTQSTTMGPNVFVDGLSDTAYSDAGPHHRWGTGAIWDNVTVNGNSLNVQNRGNSGTGHGWAGANEVVWNAKANSFVVQNPPGARNWLIGSVGTIQNGTMFVGPHDPGTYDSHGTNVFPNSLYYAQLQDRLAAPNLETREYWIGDIDQFVTASPTGDVVQVNAAWRSNVVVAAGGAPVVGLDFVGAGQWIPFTFSNSVAANERIIGASLAISLRGAGAAASNAVLYLDTLTTSNRFADLGWLPVSTGTNTTVRVLDLDPHLAALTDGQFNLAVQGDVGVDWALLEVHVATNVVSFTNTLPPVADAFVRGGIYADDNYGTSSTLTVKLDSADVLRRAYLRWDLTGVTNPILHARVRITPTGVGTNALQNALALANTNNWSETSLTWSNQPGGGKRFASWLAGANDPVEVVVTPQAQGAAAGDRQLAFQLASLSSVGGPGLVNYAAREDATPSRRPQLILVLGGSSANTAPAISTLTNRTAAADTTVGPLPFTVQDAQAAPQNLALSATSSNTTLVPVANIAFGGAGSNRTVTVTPAPGQSGASLITVTVTDPGGLTANAAFTLTIISSNASVFATNDTFNATEDTALIVPAPGVLANDTNLLGPTLLAVLLVAPTNGSLTLNPDGSFAYLPATNYFGTDAFTYRATDGVITSGVATVSLTIAPVNDAPVAVADSFNLVENIPLVVAAPGVLTNDTDVDGDVLSAALIAAPTNGVVSLATNGGFTYTPSANYVGPDAFTYVASDGAATSAVTTVSLAITAAPEPATNGSWAVNADGAWSVGANWVGGAIANAADQTATFAVDVTAVRRVNLDTPRTLGNLNFSDLNTNSSGGWLITNSPLTLQVSAGTPVVAVTNSTAGIESVLGGTQGFNKLGEGTLVLSGSNTFSGGVTISTGAVQVENSAALGSTASGTTIQNGSSARLELTGGVNLAEPLTVACKASAAGNVPAVVNLSGTNTLAGQINLIAGGSFWTFQAAGGKLRVSGATTNSTTTNVRTLWLRGTAEGEWLSDIGDSATNLATAIRKDDSGTWTLAGQNTSSGALVVSNGTLNLTGAWRGPVTVSAATLAFGPALATPAISNNLTLSASSTTRLKLSALATNSDRVIGLSNVVYAGTLELTNLAGTLAGGQSFQLFSAASFSGNFAALTPASPGPNLNWSFNPAGGALNIVALAPPQFTQATVGVGNLLQLAGTGPTNQPYRLLATTNLTLAFTDWTLVTTGIFSSGAFSVSDSLTNHSQRFYRLITP